MHLVYLIVRNATLSLYLPPPSLNLPSIFAFVIFYWILFFDRICSFQHVHRRVYIFWYILYLLFIHIVTRKIVCFNTIIVRDRSIYYLFIHLFILFFNLNNCYWHILLTTINNQSSKTVCLVRPKHIQSRIYNLNIKHNIKIKRRSNMTSKTYTNTFLKKVYIYYLQLRNITCYSHWISKQM